MHTSKQHKEAEVTKWAVNVRVAGLETWHLWDIAVTMSEAWQKMEAWSCTRWWSVQIKPMEA